MLTLIRFPGILHDGITFLGAYDGGSHYYGGVTVGWVTRARFLDVFEGRTPDVVAAEALGLRVGSITGWTEEKPNPYPNNATFLGFAELPAGFTKDGVLQYGHAVFVNVEKRGCALVDVTTIGRGVVERKPVFEHMMDQYVRYRVIVPPEAARDFGLPDTTFVSSVTVPVCMAPSVDAVNVSAALQTFIGAWDGRRHYYCGVRDGWVTTEVFEGCHGQTPAAYCRRRYPHIVPRGGTGAATSLCMFPNPFPGRPTFLGVMPCAGGGMTVHLNVHKILGDSAEEDGVPVDLVQDASAGSPGALNRSALLTRRISRVSSLEGTNDEQFLSLRRFQVCVGDPEGYGVVDNVEDGVAAA